MNRSFKSVLVGSLVCSMMWPSVSFAGLEEDLLFGDNQGIFVASQQYEPLTEAPVISNVITAEEIRRMGARTLNDVLLTLPGFSHIQDQNEYYSAERGIYASAQQKVLVLRDGHRLNNRSYSEANFDYSISLDNVKRIEVLRGPGGSLYGDVALTAVVNIITQDGKDIDGVKATIGAGSYGQQKASLMAGKQLGENSNFSFMGTFFQSDGQKRSWSDPRQPNRQGESIVYGFRDDPAYDTYLRYKLSDFTVSASRRYSHYIEPRTGGGATGYIYDYDKFASFNGEKPGLSTTFDHFEAAYAPKINDIDLSMKLYVDDSEIHANIVTDTTIPNRRQGYPNWKEWVLGVQTQGTMPYNFETLGSGNLVLGAQAEGMEVYDSDMQTGIAPNFAHTTPLQTGKERTYAAYAQAKHTIIKGLIANAGVRYDYKERRSGTDTNGKSVDNVDELSPRAALIYSPLSNLSLRASYAHSFVDAPYWYRYNQLPGYQGAITLKPEKLDTYQLSVEHSLFEDNSLSNRINFFSNDFTDVVYRNNGVYGNAGTVKSNGIEYEIGYRQAAMATRANYTYQNTTEATGYAVKEWQLENVPQHMANLLVDYALFKAPEGEASWSKDLWLNLNLRYVGKQYSRWGKTLSEPADGVDEAVITNLGMTFDDFLVPGVALQLHAYNVFDQKYYQGGSVEYPYLQPGTWYMGELSYKF